MAVSKFLIDSHVFLWLLQEPQKIGKQALGAIASGGTIYLSLVSIWELAIKYSKGQLDFSPGQLIKIAESSNFSLLPIDPGHIALLPKIITKHDDPFDKMLLAQGLAENLPLVTADKTLLQTKYQTIDARL